MDEPLVLVLPDTSEATQHVFEFTVRHGWELGSQRGDANVRTVASQEPNDLIPQATRGTTGWPPSDVRLKAIILKSPIPMTQGTRRHAQAACRFRACDTLPGDSAAEAKDDPAGVAFRLAAVPLASRSASTV
jgi:hypothetical protein